MLVCVVATSCKNKASNEQTEKKDTAIPINETSCFIASKNRDTVFIILHQTDKAYR